MGNFIYRSALYLLLLLSGILDILIYITSPSPDVYKLVIGIVITLIAFACVYTEYKKNRSFPTNIIKGLLFLLVSLDAIYKKQILTNIDFFLIGWFLFLSVASFYKWRSSDTLIHDGKLTE